MARPTKQGIDYFPVDTDFDDNIEMYLLEKEGFGLAVMVTAWQLIYRNHGYYAKNGEDFFLLIKKRISGDLNVIKDCINSCLARGIFDKTLHKQFGILTSKGIQKRYFDAAKKKKGVLYNPKFLLIDVNSYQNLVPVSGNGITGSGNATKEKEKGEEKEKEKGERHNRKLAHEWPEGFLLSDRMRTYAVNAGVMSPEKEFERFESKAKAKGYKYKDWEAAWRNWCLSDFTKKGHPGEEFLT